MFGDDSFSENGSVTAVLKHRACHESDRKKKKSPKLLSSFFFNADGVNSKNKQTKKVKILENVA